ncbi:Gfo/Idh/MocA family oxidoreductase [Pelagicoccus sp. SDUM812003]|uniref:Gfo/Idh/MocA family protein n=1 Tax=Pelagicoccus sp. SDUM812003 TaxID=3041267 RepID=UPI00280C65C2|nr:Gfo/Idh/MocA family oxidoreductase [Pelagicoccus sp. SDUM812003]MDQ8201606.1 Gfo/Idh/MocA family oxidoreductase [Pelagicoccus sp. SDUM812003]
MNELTRRELIKTSALAAAGAVVFPHILMGGSKLAANEKVNVAFVGAGGRGKNNIQALAGENIVALCDVDDERAAEMRAEFPKAKAFKDYRVMLDQMGAEIDAVVITTPDHMHYPIAMWAIAHGKHVYCEKPLTRCIWEARELRRAAKEAGVISQMGNQGHTYAGLRLIQEWYQAGILGEVKNTYHWTNRPFWPQGYLDRGSDPVPAHLDYELWLGVAPKKSYSSRIVPFNWRGWRDYGCGSIGDMACHIMDSAYSGLGLGYPDWVETQATRFNQSTFPSAMTTQMFFKGRDGRSDITTHWFEGGPKPLGIPHVPDDFFDSDAYGSDTNNGSFIVGEDITLYTDTYSGSVRVFPDETFQEIKPSLPPKTLPRIKGGPQKEFADAIREGGMPGSNFDYAAPFTEVALLGNVSLFAGTRIEYDPVKMKVKNNRKANKFLYSLYDYDKSFLTD